MLPFRHCNLEIKILHYCTLSSSLVAQSVKNLPAVQETRGQSLDWEDPLEKEMATHSFYPCWKNLMDSGASWATVHGVAKSQAQLSH